ncbi:MAG: insulinase family protein [Acidobacteriia bacterium]|nr:insulinase family protein [Terriglobia bacterium]
MTPSSVDKRPLAFNTSDIIKKILPNGLTLLVCERHNTSTISIEVSLLAGSRLETDEVAGLASLTGRLLTEGTTSRSAEEIALTIESVGGSMDSGTGTEGAVVSASTLSRDFDLGMELCADVLLQPAFEVDRVTHEREKTISEIRSAQDRPRTVLDWKFNELIYGTHPLHRPSVGYEASVARIDRDQIVDFHRRFFVPGHCSVSVVGDFESEVIMPKLEKIFGSWTAIASPVPEIPGVERQATSIEEFVPMDKEQVNIYIGHLGIRRSNPDYYPLNVLDVILGSAPGFTSRIPKRLRDEQGLAYSTFANITQSSGLDPGRFVAYIGTSPENRQRAIEGIFGEIRKVVEQPVAPDELRDAKQYLTGSFVFQFQTNSQIAHFMILAERYGLGFDYVEKYPELINAVTIDDLSRVATTYLHPEAATVVVVGPKR